MKQQQKTKQIHIKINDLNEIFNEKFIPLLENQDRYTLLIGGGGSGKSVFAVQKLILKAMKSQRRVLVVRKVATTLRASIFELFLQQLSTFHILSMCKVTTSNLKITLPNASEFLFMGLDDPEKIKSITGIDDILIEECTELTLDDYTQLQIRLRSNKPNPQIHLMMNPVSKSNWTYKHFFEQKQPDTLIHHSTYKDNKFLPQSYIDTLESYKESNPLYYQIYALGEFGNLDKTIFDNWTVQDFEDKGDLWVAIDWGFSNDPTAIIGCYIEGSNLYVVDEVYKKGMFIEDIAREIKAKGWDRYSVFCDSAEPRSIADIKREGIKAHAVKKGKDSILHGIQWLQSMNIIVHPRCENLIQELKDYTWLRDKDGVYINKPNPNCADHLIDALRYATSTIRDNKKITFLPKSVFGI